MQESELSFNSATPNEGLQWHASDSKYSSSILDIPIYRFILVD